MNDIVVNLRMISDKLTQLLTRDESSWRYWSLTVKIENDQNFNYDYPNCSLLLRS